MNDLKFSVLIPVYNMDDTIGDTLRSILSQSYENFEIIIQDNDSPDKTAAVIQSFGDKRIKYYKNEKNIGAMRSLIRGKENCSGDIIYLMAADDILGEDALLKTYNAFKIADDIGVVTRPYFWFRESINVPVRVTPILNKDKDEVVYIQDYEKAIYVIHNEIIGQLSGLAFRAKYMTKSFRDDQWTCHAYPFINIFKNHPAVFLKDYTIAVRIGSGSTRADIYHDSPMMSWIKMFADIFPESEFQEIKKKLIKDLVATNYVGLVQIKNYGKFKSLLREIFYLMKYRSRNILKPAFWFFSLGCLMIPSFILRPTVDYYKNKINSKIIKKINFEYNLKNN